MIRTTALASAALLALAACAPDPLGRDRFVTSEVQTVLYGAPGEPFEVRFKAGNGAGDYWCAAGRFATFLGMSPSTRIYRVSPSPRPQGEGVSFSFTRPPGGAQPTGLATLGGSDSLSSSSARHQCDIIRLQRQRF